MLWVCLETHGRYLTSVKLFNLQQADSNFRRQFLVQFLILFQSLTAKNKFRKAPDGSPRDVSSSVVFPFAFVPIIFDSVLRFRSCLHASALYTRATTPQWHLLPCHVVRAPTNNHRQVKMKGVDCLGCIFDNAWVGLQHPERMDRFHAVRPTSFNCSLRFTIVTIVMGSLSLRGGANALLLCFFGFASSYILVVVGAATKAIACPVLSWWWLGLQQKLLSRFGVCVKIAHRYDCSKQRFSNILPGVCCKLSSHVTWDGANWVLVQASRVGLTANDPPRRQRLLGSDCQRV
jgi:hypothetical protein